MSGDVIWENSERLAGGLRAVKSPRKRGLVGGMMRRRDYFASLRITSVALVPPKPKLLDITVVSSRWVG